MQELPGARRHLGQLAERLGIGRRAGDEAPDDPKRDQSKDGYADRLMEEQNFDARSAAARQERRPDAEWKGDKR